MRVHSATEGLAVLAHGESEWCVEYVKCNNHFDNSAAERDLGYRCRRRWKDAVNRFDFAQQVPDDVRHGFESPLAAWDARVSDTSRR